MADPFTIFLINFAIAAATSFLVIALSPTVKQQGPKLSDRRIQTSTYGSYIKHVYGTARIAGNIIWVEDNELKEKQHVDEYGKGGSGVEVTTYTYSASFAVALCDHEISGISRIWADSKLIYDISQEDAIVLYESQRIASAIEVKLGTLDQGVHPRIEANQADTPAYRGIAYVVLEDLQLDEFGNRIPNMTFEVSQPDQSLVFSDRLHANEIDGNNLEQSYPQSMIDGVIELHYSRYNVVQQQRETLDIQGNLLGVTYDANTLTIPVDMLGIMGPGRVGWTDGNPGNAQWPATLEWEHLLGTITYDILASCGIQTELLAIAFSTDNRRMMIMCNDDEPSPPWNNGQTVPVTHWYLISVGIFSAEIVDNGTAEGFTTGARSFDLGSRRGGNPGYGGNFYASCLENDYRHWWSVYSAINKQIELYKVGDDKVLRRIDDPLQWRFDAGGFGGDSFCSPWVIADKGICVVGGESRFDSNSGWTGVFSRWPVEGQPSETLSVVVADLCAKAGIVAGDIDVTELTDQVKGFPLESMTSTLSNLQLLQLAYTFDIVESEYKLKFKKRGASSIASLSIDDLSARISGDDAPDPLTVERENDLKLTKMFSLTYYDRDRDYNIGQQYRSRIQ